LKIKPQQMHDDKGEGQQIVFTLPQFSLNVSASFAFFDMLAYTISHESTKSKHDENLQQDECIVAMIDRWQS